MKKHAFLLLCAIAFSPIYGALQDYFQPALNKTEAPAIENIDYIYVISSDSSDEAFQNISSQFGTYGVTPYCFPSINPDDLSCETINNVGVKFAIGMNPNFLGTSFLPQNDGQPNYGKTNVQKQTYFCHGMTRFAISNYLNHLSILQDAYDSGYSRIWVLENNIYLPEGQDLHEISSFINELNSKVGENGWDVLFTDPDMMGYDSREKCYNPPYRIDTGINAANNFKLKKDFGDNFKQVGARYGSYSMIVNRSGMEKILNSAKKLKIFLPYDHEYGLPSNIRLFCLKKDFILQDYSKSASLQNFYLPSSTFI